MIDFKKICEPYKKEAYVLKDSVAEEENTMENLKDILQVPMMMTSNTIAKIAFSHELS